MLGIPVKQIKKTDCYILKRSVNTGNFPADFKIHQKVFRNGSKGQKQTSLIMSSLGKKLINQKYEEKKKARHKSVKESMFWDSRKTSWINCLSLYLLLPIIWFTQKQPFKSSRNHLANKVETALQIMWKPWLSRTKVEKSCGNTMKIKHKPPPSQTDGLKRGGVDTGQRFVCAWRRVV